MGNSDESDAISIHLSFVVKAGDDGGLSVEGGQLPDAAALPDPVETVEREQGSR